MKKLFVFMMIISFGLLYAQENTSTVTTDGDDNDATVTQTGDLNESIIEQVTNQSAATVSQDGTNNSADMQQKGGWPAGSHSLGETGTITQLGTDNVAILRQLADADAGSNIGNQYQDGLANLAVAWQHTVNSEVDQDQLGDNNEARVYQTGFNGYVRQYQQGLQNIAAVDEQGGGGWVVGNSATQIQIGNWNKSEISQYGTGGAKSAQGNIAEVYQYGSDNWAGEGLYSNGLFGILQEGNYNSATVTQNDNVNWSEVFQIGDGNNADVTQNGGAGLYGTYGTYVNQSSVSQTGNNNNSVVGQTYVP